MPSITTPKLGKKLKLFFSHLSSIVGKEDGLDYAIKMMQDAHFPKNISTSNLIKKTLAYTCHLFSCTLNELLTERTPEIIQARKLCYIVLRNEVDLQLDDIHLIFKKDISLVSKTISACVNELAKDIDLKIKYDLLKSKVKEWKAANNGKP